MQVPRPVRYSGARMRHFSDSFEDLAARNASHVISRSPMAIASEQMKAARADGHATQRLADVRHSQRDVVNDRATAAQSAVAATLDRPQRALRSFQHALDVCSIDTRKGRQRPEGWTAEVDHLGLTPDARAGRARKIACITNSQNAWGSRAHSAAPKNGRRAVTRSCTAGRQHSIDNTLSSRLRLAGGMGLSW